MIRLPFPAPPDVDAWEEWVAAGKEAARKMREEGVRAIDDDLYRRGRSWLLGSSNRKCAYCEVFLPPGQRSGDVEHYRPKGAVRDGRGKTVRIVIDGQPTKHPGYYWLAYDPTNLLPACSACNRRARDAKSQLLTGKSDIFPTLDDWWATAPDQVVDEKPALLNPWLAEDDPSLHLAFDPETGVVIPKTVRGEETIELLGLNRDGLPEARKNAVKAAVNAYANVVFDRARKRSPDPDDNALYRAVKSGAAEYAAFCRRGVADARQRTMDELDD